MEVQDIECPNVNNLTLPEDWQLKAMKVYANQKLDEAAENAEIVQFDTEYNSRTGERDPVYCVDEQSILSLKDKI